VPVAIAGAAVFIVIIVVVICVVRRRSKNYDSEKTKKSDKLELEKYQNSGKIYQLLKIIIFFGNQKH